MYANTEAHLDLFILSSAEMLIHSCAHAVELCYCCVRYYISLQYFLFTGLLFYMTTIICHFQLLLFLAWGSWLISNVSAIN
jgi:hypothetical protein